ncbi:MAG: winged helix-turn-helix transcriptional regulator, partial [Lachnospiraceae bacterium]|nr:winged helix-turn-helix transcriptional regulator [Lachnospiraceae bacterium]
MEKICQACEEDGSPLPEYTIHPGDIMIKFIAAEDRIARASLDKVTEGVTERVTEAERKLLSLLLEDPAYTYASLAEKLGVSRKTISSRIKSLKDKGVLQRVG